MSYFYNKPDNHKQMDSIKDYQFDGLYYGHSFLAQFFPFCCCVARENTLFCGKSKFHFYWITPQALSVCRMLFWTGLGLWSKSVLIRLDNWKTVYFLGGLDYLFLFYCFFCCFFLVFANKPTVNSGNLAGEGYVTVDVGVSVKCQMTGDTQDVTHCIWNVANCLLVYIFLLKFWYFC